MCHVKTAHQPQNVMLALIALSGVLSRKRTRKQRGACPASQLPIYTPCMHRIMPNKPTPQVNNVCSSAVLLSRPHNFHTSSTAHGCVMTCFGYEPTYYTHRYKPGVSQPNRDEIYKSLHLPPYLFRAIKSNVPSYRDNLKCYKRKREIGGAYKTCSEPIGLLQQQRCTAATAPAMSCMCEGV